LPPAAVMADVIAVKQAAMKEASASGDLRLALALAREIEEHIAGQRAPSAGAHSGAGRAGAGGSFGGSVGGSKYTGGPADGAAMPEVHADPLAQLRAEEESDWDSAEGSPPVHLNVGGVHFTLSEHSVFRFPGSRLARLVARHSQQLRASEKEKEKEKDTDKEKEKTRKDKGKNKEHEKDGEMERDRESSQRQPGRLFIDRDPVVFRHVANYLRGFRTTE
jgi:hypothetical protein